MAPVDPFVIAQTGAAVITAGAASGIFVLAWRVYQTVTLHDRVLFGEEAVDGVDGIVPVVDETKTQLESIRLELRELNRRARRDHEEWRDSREEGGD